MCASKVHHEREETKAEDRKNEKERKCAYMGFSMVLTVNKYNIPKGVSSKLHRKRPAFTSKQHLKTVIHKLTGSGSPRSKVWCEMDLASPASRQSRHAGADVNANGLTAKMP